MRTHTTLCPLFAVLCLLAVSALQPSAFSQHPISPENAAALRSQICSTFFMPDPLPPLDAHTHRTFSPAPGVRAEAITYASQLGMRVPAILYLPDPATAPPPPVHSSQTTATTSAPELARQRQTVNRELGTVNSAGLPALIIVNGHGGDKYSWYSYYCGITYARAGCAVLTYDPIGEGERSRNRKSGTREHDYIRGSPTLTDTDAARHLCGLMLTDIMQAVTYLSSRPEVDPTRIAAAGYSMGSFVMALAGAIDPRIHAAIMTGGGNLDGPGGYWDNSGKPMCQSLPYQSLAFLGDRPAIIYALQADRGPALIWNGREDICNIKQTQEPFFDDLRARVAALLPENSPARANIFTYGFTPAPASHRPYFLTKQPAIWLSKQLHFPNLTTDQVAALPEVHIIEWAKAVNYPMDPGYTSEAREGGAMAIGNNVPPITRDQLSVFTPAEWEKVKNDYTLDAWLKKIGATTTRDKPKTKTK